MMSATAATNAAVMVVVAMTTSLSMATVTIRLPPIVVPSMVAAPVVISATWRTVMLLFVMVVVRMRLMVGMRGWWLLSAVLLFLSLLVMDEVIEDGSGMPTVQKVHVEILRSSWHIVNNTKKNGVHALFKLHRSNDNVSARNCMTVDRCVGKIMLKTSKFDQIILLYLCICT